MKGYTKKRTVTHGNELQRHCTKKHDANLRKNGLLHFQIGLILSLLIVYLGFETVFPFIKQDVSVNKAFDYTIEEEEVYDFKIYQEEVVKTEEPVKEEKAPPIEAIDQLEIIKNEIFTRKETDITSSDNIKTDGDLDFGAIDYDEPVDEPVNILAVEFAPVFKGCENLKSNQDRRMCLSEGINKIVLRNFRTSLSEAYGLSGKQRIDVQFTIDKEGVVTNIKVRAPHPVLEKEARRVMKLIPDMQPGKQKDKNVPVVFSKPIIFKTQ
ncbi:hypothetical protein GTQ40_14050 [Flavobacteriaceae bacterium R38]|nr:hypothetical protein [Flavobacteriaceae bacterium R38]